MKVFSQKIPELDFKDEIKIINNIEDVSINNLSENNQIDNILQNESR